MSDELTTRVIPSAPSRTIRAAYIAAVQAKARADELLDVALTTLGCDTKTKRRDGRRWSVDLDPSTPLDEPLLVELRDRPATPDAAAAASSIVAELAKLGVTPTPLPVDDAPAAAATAD